MCPQGRRDVLLRPSREQSIHKINKVDPQQTCPDTRGASLFALGKTAAVSVCATLVLVSGVLLPGSNAPLG